MARKKEPSHAEQVDLIERRLHIMTAVSTALDNARAVLDLILSASDVDTARRRLQETFGFDEVQAIAALDLQFRQATTWQRERIDTERRELLSELAAMTQS